MPANIPEITYKKIYVIHCEDCGMLFKALDSADPDAIDPDDHPTTTDTLADARRSVAAHKRYHANG